MNKVIVLVAFLLFSGFSGMKAQDKTGITISAVNSSGEGKPDGRAEITINGGTPSFTVCLFDKAPWKGGTELDRQVNVNTREVSFDKLLPGSYYVIVEDGEKNPAAGMVDIGITPNN